MNALRLPRRPILTMSPNASDELGSPTRQWSIASPSACSAATTALVPSTATPSSSPVISSDSEPLTSPASSAPAAAAMKAAMALFMSAAPRPISTPSSMRASNGSTRQAPASPTGTTSVWPAKQRLGRALPSRA